MKENQNVEFKKIWSDEYLKTLCAFANSDGGIMYLGMSDEGIPLELENTSELLENLPNKIINSLGIIPSIKTEIMEGKEVIKIEISPSELPVSYNGRFYIRSGSTTQEVKGEKLIKIIMKKQRISWDELLSDADIREIDEETVFKFKKLAKDKLAISEEDSIERILENLELIREGKLTNACVLLFGKNPQRYFFSSISRVGRFKTPTEILDTIEIKGNLFKQVEDLVSAIKKHISVKFEIKDIIRKEVWDYPIIAIREACINALVHRDYMDSADIQIRVYDDKICFWNPGELPEDISVEMLKKENISKPRNRKIAMVFYYAGLIERWGTGIKRMIDLCREEGLPEPKFEEFAGGFSVIFYKDIYNEDHLRKMGLNERQIKAILYLKEKGEITISTLKKLIPTVSEKTLYRDLKELVEKDFIKEIGTKKGRKYVLS